MRKITLARGVLLAIATSTAGLASAAHAALAYGGSLTTGQQVLYTFTGSDTGNAGFGDDYNTGQASIVLTGLSFNGGLNSSQTNTNLFVNFYTTAGVRVATISPSRSEVLGTTGVKTLASSDFMQNGIAGVTIPGAGYIIFAPYSAAIADASTNPPTITPATPNPGFALGIGSAPTVGTNNSAITAKTDAAGVLTTGAFAVGFGTPPQYAQFTLTTVPEPTSLAALALGGLGLIRRRRVGV